MLRLLLAAVTTGMFTACCAWAADVPPAALPSHDPTLAPHRAADPTFALAHADSAGTVTIQTLRRVPKNEIRTEKQTRDGVATDVTVTVTLMVPELKEEKVNLKDLQVFDAAGKAIDPLTLPERLKQETVVLLSTDGEKVDPRFLAAVKEGTLILVPPVAHTDANPAPKVPVEKR